MLAISLMRVRLSLYETKSFVKKDNKNYPIFALYYQNMNNKN